MLPCAVATAAMVALIFMGRDLGTMILLCVPPLLMIFLAGLKTRYLVTGGAILLPLIGTTAAPAVRFSGITLISS